ncbi:MAG: hypothetical protein KatS3mg038_2858 [Candidatus Kapaibacterium sp.]|nr:MAG: hypothetical protein KatS3mg038_2858 [Candidatus Kapabacteria bacterium]
MSIREAIRRVQRDPSRELGQSRRPEGYRGGTVLARVRMSTFQQSCTKPPLNQPHDIHRAILLSCGTSVRVHRARTPNKGNQPLLFSQASSSNFDFPQFPSDFDSGIKRLFSQARN